MGCDPPLWTTDQVYVVSISIWESIFNRLATGTVCEIFSDGLSRNGRKNGRHKVADQRWSTKVTCTLIRILKFPLFWPHYHCTVVELYMNMLFEIFIWICKISQKVPQNLTKPHR